ncbi:MAG TPA: carbon storage regulator [Clostridiales bacterium]|nr:carbon storage regulator [Clostridiales bacterium]
MLVLSRKKDEYILIGDNIKITLLDIGDDKVSIGIDAPKSQTIIRGELLEQTKQTNLEAIESSLAALYTAKEPDPIEE